MVRSEALTKKMSKVILSKFTFSLSIIITCLPFCIHQSLDTDRSLKGADHREDYAVDFRDKERLDRFRADVLDEIKRRGLPDKADYAITLHHYVVTTPNMSGIDRSFGVARAPYNLEYDKRFLDELTTGWGVFSINAIYKDTGIWFKENVVYEIQDPVTGSDANPSEPSRNDWFNCAPGGLTSGEPLTTFEHVDNFTCTGYAACQGSRDNFVFQLSNPVGSNTQVRSSCNEYRILWLRTDSTDDVSYSIALLGGPSVRMAATHGRNLLAHELGHNFNLQHTGDYYVSLPSVCNFSTGITYSMYTPILRYSYGFSPCEIAIMQATAKQWLDLGAGFIARGEKPSASDMAMGTAFLHSDFGNVRCGLRPNTPPESNCCVPIRWCQSFSEDVGLRGRYLRGFEFGNHKFSEIEPTLELDRRADESYYQTYSLPVPASTSTPLVCAQLENCLSER